MNAVTFDIASMPILLQSIGAGAAVAASYIGLSAMRRTARHRIQPIAGDEEELPMLSVVVYAHNSAAIITEYLDAICAQKYPDFEIIVVADSGKDDNTQEIVENYAATHADGPALYCTFLPRQSFNLSRRKMALTLGMKAAKGDVVITTCTTCMPQSQMWLNAIGRHFKDSEVDIVAGYSHVSFADTHGAGRWYRAFDTVSGDAQWIGYALRGAPYRADGMNLSFRLPLFFREKGYAQSAFIQDGDDDIFLQTIARPDNLRVEIAPEAQLLRKWGDRDKHLWHDYKERYTFTARYLKTTAFGMRRLYEALSWCVPLCISTAVAMQPCSVTVWLCSLFTLMLFWGYQICLYRRTAAILQSIRLWWSVPLFTLFRPLADMYYRLKFGPRRADNFTWAPHHK